MKKKIFTIILILVLININTLKSQSYLYVNDPLNWNWYNGIVSEATLSVKPHGAFFEYGLYLTFEVENQKNFASNNNQKLEITYTFILPKGSIIIDSWLWVEEDIMKADIMSQWSASAIYESIVKRRKDPSILTKIGEDYYQLKIYPLDPGKNRKIKIAYLVPALWSEFNITTPVPYDLITPNNMPAPNLDIIFYPKDGFTDPSIDQQNDIKFSADAYDSALKTEIKKGSLKSFMNFKFSSPMKDGVYLNYYPTSKNAGFYQMAVMPSNVFHNQKSKKVIVLLDFWQSSGDNGTLLNSIKGLLSSVLTNNDSVNILYANNSNTIKQTKWFQASSGNLQTYFNLNPDFFSSRDFLGLIKSGISLNKLNNENCKVLLFTTSASWEWTDQLYNIIFNDLKRLPDTNCPVNIFDFSCINWNGAAYTNNYFVNICQLLKGNYASSTSYGGLSGRLNSFYETTGLQINSYDLYTTLSDGVCYGRIDMNSSGLISFIDRPFIQIGKYHGEFPFSVEISGEINNQFTSKFLNIDKELAFKGDSVTSQIWSGVYINSIEQKSLTNEMINEIVQISINKRVLSKFTAFLALEPDKTHEPCENCKDETNNSNNNNNNNGPATGIVPVLTAEAGILIINAFPNPFVDFVNIDIELEKGIDLKDCKFAIYNNLGQLIKSFDVSEIQVSDKLKIEWNSLDNSGQKVKEGILFFEVLTPKGKKVIKLIKR